MNKFQMIKPILNKLIYKFKKIDKRMPAIFLCVLVVFIMLYTENTIPVEDPTDGLGITSSLEDWSIETSDMNNWKLKEDKGLYQQDNTLYDVYITTYPTEDPDSDDIWTFSSFDLHTALDKTYNPTLDCNITILGDGETFDPNTVSNLKNATIRVRGNSSRGAEFKSYKVKLNDDTESFQGQTNLNINKHAFEPYKIVTKITTDLIAPLDNLVSYRTNFMRVWIRDASLPINEQEYVYYGLYTNMEQPNNTYLESRGLPPGNLYKARNFAFVNNPAIVDVDDPSYNLEAFEAVLGIRENADGNHKDLLELIEVLNDPLINFDEVFEKYFDEDNYLTWLAMNLCVGGSDILNHNYMIYNPVNSSKWYFLPWDFDANLRDRDFEGYLASFPQYGYYELAPTLMGGQKLNMSPLHSKYLCREDSFGKIKAKIDELMSTVFTDENINNAIAGYMPVLEETLTLYPDVTLLEGKTPNQVFHELSTFTENFKFNIDAFNYIFDFPAPMFVNDPYETDEGLFCEWEPSYSYQGRIVTYDVVIATDPKNENIIYHESGIVDTTHLAKIDLEPGKYYLNVYAIDDKGNKQFSLEHYETNIGGWLYSNGTLEFRIK